MSAGTGSARQIRVAAADDAVQILAIYAPIVAETAISFEDELPTTADMAQRIALTLPTYPYLVCEEAGRIVGYAYASDHRARAAYRWSVDTTVYVHAQSRHRGVGRDLYTALLGILRRQRFHAAFAGIALPNDDSVGLHEAMGFMPVGVYRDVGFKLGRWHDVGWWRLGLQEGLPAGEPIAFSRLVDEFDSVPPASRA